MIQYLVICYVILLSLSRCSRVDVVTSVVKILHPCGIHLLLNQSAGSTEIWTFVEMQKRLSQNVIATSSAVFGPLNTVRCTPLYVILSETHLVQQFLLQISIDFKLSTAKWLIFFNKNTELEIFFRDIYIPINCELFVVQEVEGTVTLVEVYRARRELPLITRHCGKWTDQHGMQWLTESLYKRRSDLNGLVVNTAYINQNHYFTLEEHDGSVEIQGYFGLVWKTLEARLNFTSCYVSSEDGFYGSQQQDGTFNGLVNMIQYGRAHVTSSNIMMSPNRRAVVDFLAPLLEERTYIFIKEPDFQSMKWTDFIRPFSAKLWFAQLGIIMLLGFVLWFLCNYDTSSATHYTIHGAMFAIFSTICLQSQDFSRRSDSCKVLFLTSYVTATVLLSGYSASLISTLTIKEAVLPFTDFIGLLREGTHKVGLLPNSAEFDIMKFSPDLTVYRVYSELIKPYEDSLPSTDEEAFQRVCNEKFAYMADYIETMVADLPCRVVNVPQAFFPTTLSLAIKKHSPYRSLFNFHLNEMRRNGMLKRLKDQLLNTRGHYELSHSRWVNVLHVMPLFVILTAGVVLSFLILVVEKKNYARHSCVKKSLKYESDCPQT